MPDSTKKTSIRNRIVVYITDEEEQELRMRAAAAGTYISPYTRGLIQQDIARPEAGGQETTR